MSATTMFIVILKGEQIINSQCFFLNMCEQTIDNNLLFRSGNLLMIN